MRIYYLLTIPSLLIVILPVWLISFAHPCRSSKVPDDLLNQASSIRKMRKRQRRTSKKIFRGLSRNNRALSPGGGDRSQDRKHNELLISELIKEMNEINKNTPNNALYDNTLDLDNKENIGFLRKSNNTRTAKKEMIDNMRFRRKQTEKDGDEEIMDCVIIGAGWSGIAAAMRLQAGRDGKSMKNVKILEARSYIGGRSHTKEVVLNDGKSSHPIDLGSQWIHGVNGNPITTIMQQNDIPLAIEVDPNLQVYERDQGGVVDESQDYFDELYDGFYNYQAGLQCSTDEDQSLADVADTYRRENNIINDDKKDRYFKFAMNNLIEQSYGASLDDLSLWWWNMDDGFSGSDAIPINGYESAINSYASRRVKSQIMLDTRVSKIDYSRDNVSPNDPTASITIEYYKDNSEVKNTIQTKNVIITVPLGVLKETNNKVSKITFQPPLPRRKQRAISRIGMGIYNKIIMFWKEEDVFWPKDIEWYGDVVDTSTTVNDNEKQHSYKFEFYTPFSLNGGRPFMVGFLNGDDAWKLELKYDNCCDNDKEESDKRYQDEMTSEAMKSLRNMFGSQIPEPEKVVVTRWGTDPYSLGSYSFNKVGMGMTYNARSNLAQPIELEHGGGLYFAGEATSSDYFGTTHGAFLSGREAAEKLLANTDDDELQVIEGSTSGFSNSKLSHVISLSIFSMWCCLFLIS